MRKSLGWVQWTLSSATLHSWTSPSKPSRHGVVTVPDAPIISSPPRWAGKTFLLRHQKQLKFLQLIEFQLSLNSLIVKLSRLLLIEFLFAFISTPLLSSFSLLLTHSFLAENVTMLTTKQRKKAQNGISWAPFSEGVTQIVNFPREKLINVTESLSIDFYDCRLLKNWWNSKSERTEKLVSFY